MPKPAHCLADPIGNHGSSKQYSVNKSEHKEHKNETIHSVFIGIWYGVHFALR
jgi:hypothetical protein